MNTLNLLANPALEPAEKLKREAICFFMKKGVSELVATQRVENKFLRLNNSPTSIIDLKSLCEE
ncbi:hypothetical protein TUM4438_39960 [Shewanella sairae]|uniref:Uncharacterized protein n=1 Tax=Shewanella sairae TaxID=190310 RepID=A0ABQ4PQ81_9GAMM|nr:hypothetical protein [Shewanella sairae]MCL1132220.1 hypothetical protein [Shewanella sairae]GIU51192.1 hypothetical protein TUM4438_39960 [Shewanella sairae]